MWRISLVVLMAPIVVLAVVMVVRYADSFLPHLSELEKIAAEANEQVVPIADAFYPLAVAVEGKDNIRSYAMQEAYRSLGYDEHKMSFEWFFDRLIWKLSSHLHLDEREVFGIWVSCSLFGCGKGLFEAARKYHGKEIVELSCQELAGLAAVVQAPMTYKPRSKKSEERITEILTETKLHDCGSGF